MTEISGAASFAPEDDHFFQCFPYTDLSDTYVVSRRENRPDADTFLQITGRTATKLETRYTSLCCGCSPLAAGLCAVTAAAAVDTFGFISMISCFVFHKLETFYLMNVGADMQKRWWGCWESNVIGGRPTTVQHR